jgi:hypothetical protein
VTQDSLVEINSRFGETHGLILSSLTKEEDSSNSLYISASVQAIHVQHYRKRQELQPPELPEKYFLFWLIWHVRLSQCGFNHLKPTGYVMLQHVSHLTIYALPTLYLCVLYLSEDSDLCHLHHKLIGFYNRDEKCLQRGTDWVFK